MKKTMSFAKQVHLLKVVSGIAWIVVGVSVCFESILCTVIQAVGLVVCIACLVFVALAEKENSDEMAEANLHKAKATTLDVMHMVFCIAAIVAILSLGHNLITLDWSVAVRSAAFFIMGAENLLVGITFRKLEAE